MTARSVVHSRTAARRRKRRTIFLICGAVALLALIGGSIALARWQVLRITQISISGTTTVSSSSVTALLSQGLSGNYALVFPKNNIFLYPKQSMAASILHAFPAIADVSISAQTFSSVAVTILEREPSALWCGTAPASSSPCYLMDEGGVVYALAPQFSSPPYTLYYGAITGNVRALPVQYVTLTTFQSLSSLIDVLQKQAEAAGSGTLQSVAVDANNDVHVQFQSGFVLLFALSDDGATVLTHFTLARTAAPFVGHSLSDFQYLDLRFGDKLYYKLKP